MVEQGDGQQEPDTEAPSLTHCVSGLSCSVLPLPHRLQNEVMMNCEAEEGTRVLRTLHPGG